LDRIAVAIQGLTGMALSNPSVWRLLRSRLLSPIEFETWQPTHHRRMKKIQLPDST
jgi:hypothetical protein